MAHWNARRLGRVEACVQFGTDFDLPADIRYVTFDDQTIVQAARSYDYPWLSNLSRSETIWLVEKQQKVFERARMCCVPTQWAAQSLIADYGIPVDRVHVVGIGANNVVRGDTHGRDWSRPRFLFVGFNWERKNGSAVLDCFRRLRLQHPHAQLDLVGSHPVLDEPGVTGHGILDLARTDHQAALARLFHSATAFVMPSLHEPCGIVYVEAAAAGIGSIGSTSGGSSTIIGDGGIVVDPRSGDQILSAMQAFCDPDLAASYGARALNRADLLTWPKVTSRLLAASHGESPTTVFA